MSFGFLFFLPAVDDETPHGYLPDSALLILANGHRKMLDETAMDGVFDPEDSLTSTPAAMTDLVGWINHHAHFGAYGGDSSPAFHFLTLSEIPVTPTRRVLHIEVPIHTAEDTGRHFQFKAAELGICMVDDLEQVWVNPTGSSSGLRMRDSLDAVTTHVDRASILTVLGEDVDRRRRADHGIPYVVIEASGGDAASPIIGIRYVQAALTGGGWVVEYRTSNRYYRLRQKVQEDDSDTGEALAYISQVLSEYALGEDDAFYEHQWEDASAELVV